MAPDVMPTLPPYSTRQATRVTEVAAPASAAQAECTMTAAGAPPQPKPQAWPEQPHFPAQLLQRGLPAGRRVGEGSGVIPEAGRLATNASHRSLP